MSIFYLIIFSSTTNL